MKRITSPRGPTAQSGIALILVLWITTLLTLIASSFIHAMRTDINIVGNSVSRAKLEAATSAAVHRALLEMAKPEQFADRWKTDGVPLSWQFHDVPVQLSIFDESGKIDINSGNEALIRGLFRSQGLTDEQAAALSDAVGDWRDPDSLKRPRGAEEPEYTAAGLAYKPNNAPFQSIDELRLVLGMTPELYQRIAPQVTIYSRQPGINTQIASRDVLRAVPGVTDGQVDEYLAQREAARSAKLPIPVFAPAQNLQSFRNGVVTIRAEAQAADGSVFIREAVALRLPNPKRSYTFLRWQEGERQNISPDGAIAPPPAPPANT
jgi:general secretion pathway protein K